jgi:hypothetical protein
MFLATRDGEVVLNEREEEVPGGSPPPPAISFPFIVTSEAVREPTFLTLTWTSCVVPTAEPYVVTDDT